MRLRDWPIARRLTGAMILLTVATAVTVQVRGLYRGRAEFTKSSHKTLDVAARKTAMQLDLLLRKARVDVRTLAVNRAIIDLCTGADSPRAKDLLDSYVDNDSDLAMLLVAGTDGSVLTSARDVAKKDANVRTRPYFAPALGGKTYVSGLLWGPSGSGVYLAHPVQRGDSVLGVIVLKLDGDRIVNLIRDMKPLKDGLVGVLYEKLEGDLFVVIASGDRKVEYTTGRPMTEAQAAIAQQRWNRPIRVLPVTSLVDREIGGSATQDGVEWVFGVARPKEAPWIVLTRLSREQFESDFYDLARKQLLVLLVALAFAGLLAYGQARMILRPVRTLTETAERIAGGDLEARAEITTEDELGRLARVFDQMVPHLAERVKLQESLAVAGSVQRDLLPKTPPEFPGLDVYGANEPYEQIGGDYFD
ncbi:MAG: HAMP domain-containing protein, partial [Planctomycetota bacterium]